jgi:hypothetical protein
MAIKQIVIFSISKFYGNLFEYVIKLSLGRRINKKKSPTSSQDQDKLCIYESEQGSRNSIVSHAKNIFVNSFYNFFHSKDGAFKASGTQQIKQLSAGVIFGNPSRRVGIRSNCVIRAAVMKYAVFVLLARFVPTPSFGYPSRFITDWAWVFRGAVFHDYPTTSSINVS